MGTTVRMDGSASSDPDNDPITYVWQFSLKPASSTATLNGATTTTPSFVPDVPGLYSLQLTVTDPHGATGTAGVNVTAEVANHAPTITSTPITTATATQLYTYDVEATDPDAGDVLTYSLVEKPEGMTINATTGLIEWTPTAAQVGDQPVAVKVQDQDGLFVEQSFTVTVASLPPTCVPPSSLVSWWPGDGNAQDFFGSNHGTLDNGATFAPGLVGQAFRFDGVNDSVQIPHSSSLQRSGPFTIEFWFNPGLTMDSSVPNPRLYTFWAKGADNTINTANNTVNGVRDPVLEVRGPTPRPNSTTNTWTAGTWYHAAVTLDASGYKVFVNGVQQGSSPSTFSILDNANKLVLGWDAVSSHTPFNGLIDEPTLYNRALSAQEIQAIFNAGSVGKCKEGLNHPPTITSTPVTTATAGQLYTYDVDATDPDAGDPLTFSLPTASIGMTINAATGLIQWTPTAAQVGNQDVTVRVTDKEGLFAEQNFVLSVAADNHPPVITSTAVTTATATQPYAYDVEATDPDADDVLTYSLPTKPNGMAINTTTGVIQWTPTAAQTGSQNVTVRVQDQGGLFAEQSFVLNVVSGNLAPVITSTAVTTATVGQLYTYDVNATDPDAGDTLTFSLPTQPDGMTINATTGLIEWTPTTAQVGDHPITVKVQDQGGLFAEQSFAVTVASIPGNPPVITSTPDISRWTQLTPTGTPPKAGNGEMVAPYDATTDRMIVFGHNNSIGQLPQMGSIWVLENATQQGGTPVWTQFTPAGTPPASRIYHAPVYDFTSNRVIFHGGCGGLCGPALADTWVVTNANGLGGPSEWVPLPSGSASAAHAAVYDAISNRMIVFGGHTAVQGGDRNDVRVLIDANGIGDPRWITLSPTGTLPPPRGHASAAYDAIHNRLIIFGGLTTTRQFFNDVWVLSNANGLGGTPQWTQLAPGGAPPALRGHAGVFYDPNANRLVLFGGFVDAGWTYLGDTWILTYANGEGGTPHWINLNALGSAPLPRSSPLVAYSSATNRMVTFGGRGDGATPGAPDDVLFNDTYLLTNANGQCTAGQPCNYDVDATDPDAGDTLTFSLDTTLAGMTIDPATGLIQWTPTPAQIGDHAVTVRVRDASGLSATQTFTLTVASVAVPNVVGLAPEWAKALIGAADLTVGTETHTSGEIKLNFDTLPSAQGWTYFPFGNSAPEATVFSISNGSLLQNSIGVGFAGQGSNRYNIPSLVNPTFNPVHTRFPFTISVRARVLEEEGDILRNSFGFWFGLFTGSETFGVGLGRSQVQDQRVRVIANLDNTQFHDYQLAGAPGIGYQFFADNTLLATGPIVRSTFTNSVSLGDGTGGVNARAEVTAFSFTQSRVTAQNPPAGTLVPNKSNVDLTIQDGPATATVPNVVGLTQTDATTAIVAASLTVGAITTANSNAVPAGQVISQTPVANTKVPPNTAVNFVLSLGPTPGSHPPTITSTALTAATVGQPYTYDVNATDPDVGDTLTYSLPTAPNGMTINATTGVIQWTPTAAQTGNQNITVRVQDQGGLFATQAFTIVVATQNHAPIITSTPITAATATQPYTYDVEATDPDVGDVLTFSLVAKPDGMTINTTTGLIQWTPTTGQVGDQNVTVRVTDSGSLFAEQSFTIIVSAAPTTVTVPSVVGLTQATATSTLTTANLTLGTVTTVNSDAALTLTTLPSAQGWLYGAFGNSATETQVFSLNAGVLQQNTLGLTDGFNFYQLPGIVQAAPFAFTVTARVLAQEGDATDAFGFGFAVTVGTEQFAFGLRTTGIHDPVGNILSTTIDTTQFHEYRLEGTPGGGYRLFVDGVLIGSGSPGTRSTAASFLSFGDLSDTANARGEVTKLSFVQNAGKVIAQQPAAGTAVPEGTAVNLTIVKAPASVTVPNVVGQSEASAKATLIAATLLVGTVTQENSDTVPAGNVISQTPTAGTSVPELSVVNLVVSKGPPPPQTVTVPNLVGLTQAAATQALTTATLKAGAITQANSPTVPAGNVMSQTPAAGASVPKDSAVDFVVSLGPPPPPPTDLASILVQPANPLILTTQTQAFTAIGILSDGSSKNLNGQVTWTSSAPAIASISNSGVATGLAEGTTTISATAGSITGSTILTVKASVTDGTLPIAAITAPANDATITSPVDVIGTASDANFLKYVLDYAPVGESTFTTIVTGTTAVTNGVLGTLDPTLLLNDLYTVRLTVIDRANNQAETSIQVQVAREQKVGNFTLAFQDLSVPVAGLPITVVRTYDSRDKGKGDFGIGWRLDIQTLRLKVTGVMGANWQQNQSGSVLNRRYDLVPTATHKVSITLPDGKVEEFDFTPTPTSQPLAPIQVVTVGYTRRAQTRGTLRALGETSLVTFGVVGPLDLLLESDPSVIYDPQTFEYTTPEGQVITIDRTAGVQSVRDLNGNTLTFGPNGIIHSAGKSITFIRDAQQRITQITDPKGNSQTYTYDANGDLKSHTDAAGNTTSFLYNFRHDLIEIKDPRGIRPVRNEYDDAGRLIKHIDAFGKEITYTHNIGVREEIITDRLGQVTKHEYDQAGNVVRTTDANGGITDRTYDARGNTLTEKDPLNRTRTYTYDANDNRLSESDPLGNVTSYTYNSRNQVLTVSQPGSGTTTNTYNANGNLTSTKDPSGKTTTYTYNAQGLQLTQTDPLGNVTIYSYDGVGNLLTETNPLNHGTTYTYDTNGNRLTQTTTNNGQTLVTTFQYDALNRLVKTTFPDTSTSQTGYNSIGKQSATTDQGGRQTSYQYDDLGRLTKTTYPDGTSESSTYDAEGRRLTSTDRGGRVTTYSYDALGRLVTATAPDSSSTSTTYDPAGQVTATTDALGRGTMYEYDLAGRRTKVTDALGQVTTFTYDAAGNQKTVTDAKGNVTTFSYDANNRRTGVSYADGTGESTVYDALGRTTSKTDQGGKTTTFTYDALGRLLTVTDALNQVTQYTYDDLGNQLTQTDANGNTTTFAYDKVGRRTQRALPAGQTETYAYNAAGNLTSKQDFNGKLTQFTYDAVNRLLSKTPDPTLGEPTVTFSYTSSGQRASMSDASGTTSYTYDNRDRLIQKATPQGTLTYTYDLAGNLQSMDSSHANGVSVDYSYDTLNRLSTVNDTRLANGVTTYSYDNVGNLDSYLYPNGVKHQYTYSTVNRLTNLTLSKATTLASFAYTLGAAGNRTAVTEQNGRTASYSYDSLYRLTNETIAGDLTGINGSIGYTYDPVGNRKTRTSTVAGIVNQTFTYDANDRLSTDSYDPNGNTTGSDGKTYDYDFENHLTNQNGSGVEIVYDGDGNRVAKTVGGVTTRYLIDDRNHTGYAQVVEEIVDGTVQRSYTYGLDLISQNQANGVSFYGYDGHGSVRLLTDVNGNVTDTYTYEAFGNVIGSIGTTPNNYLYSGEQSDPNLGFYYLRARYLNPSSGRFLTLDNFEGDDYDPVSLHKYLYANVDPVNQIDTSGRTVSLTEVVVVSTIIQILAGAVLGGLFAHSRGQSTAGGAGVGALSGLILGPFLTILSVKFVVASAILGIGGSAIGAIEARVAYLDGRTKEAAILGILAIAGLAASGVQLGSLSTLSSIRNAQRADAAGIQIIEEHLQSINALDVPYNPAQINRLKAGFWDAGDQNFYKHELMEAFLMRGGASQEHAHAVALTRLGHKPRDIYSPNIIQQFLEWFGTIPPGVQWP